MKIFKPTDISGMTSADIKAAYQHLRKLANKRIVNLEKRGIYVTKQNPFTPTGTTRLNTSAGSSYRFPAASQMMDADIETALKDVSMWLRNPSHTVRGEKKRRQYMITAFRKRGYTFVDDSNFYDFVQYMEDLREQYGSKAFDSGDAADVYSNAQRIGIDSDTLKSNFDYFADHLEQLSRMRPVRSEKGATFEALEKKIKRLED